MEGTANAGGVAPGTSTAVESTKKSIEYVANTPKTNVLRKNASNAAAPRFALPSELTQPSAVLASLHEKSAPVRPDGGSQHASQMAVQQATTAAAALAATPAPARSHAPP